MARSVSSSLSAELRASLFHFTVYLGTGVGAVYFAIWLSGKQIPPDQIGIINAAPVLVLLAINLFIGRLADRAGDWRTVILILSLIAGAVPIGLFLVDEFWGILLVWTLCAVSAGAIPPVIDAASVRLAQRNGSDFGAMRAWGTVGYMAATGLTGAIIFWFGPGAFVPFFVFVSLLRAGLSLQLPRFRGASGPAETSPPRAPNPSTATRPDAARTLRAAMTPWFVLPLIAFALINATHVLLSIFVALVWYEAGVPEATIGQLIAVAAAAEALMMFVWRRVGRRVTARQMMLASAIVVVLRWVAMGFSPPVEVLFALQTLHAITFALGYFGLVHFIANWTGEEIAAEAQGFAFVLQQAMAFIALLGFGFLFERAGISSFFVVAGFGGLAALCLLVSLRLKPAR